MALAQFLLAVLAISQESQPLPDFSGSAAVIVPAQPRAGDVIRYEIKVLNKGGSAGTSSVSSELPQGYLIDLSEGCASAKVDPVTRHTTWYEGQFEAGETRTCVIRLLSRRAAAGTQANVDTGIAAFRPDVYWRFSADAELGSIPDPNRVRVGSFFVARAGLAVLGLLGLFIAGIPVLSAIASSTGSRQGAIRAWSVVVVCLGFLAMFVALGYDDYRAATAFRETRCAIFGQDESFAVRYSAFGVETFSSGFGTATRLGFGSKRRASGDLGAFRVGSSHPCWYDPEDVKTVLLDRSPGGAYIFSIIPLMTLLYAGIMLWSVPKKPARSG